MKATKIIFSALVAVLALGACTKNVWVDNTDVKAYFPHYGYTQNTIWAYEGGSYQISFGVAFGGLRPDNRLEDLTVNYAVDPAVVDAYNEDITQQYSGELEVLPADCYSVEGTSAVVKVGEVSAVIPVVFNVAAIKTAIAESVLLPTKRYVVPLALTGVSKYELHDNAEMTRAMIGITLADPAFYFYANRSGVSLASRKLVSGSNDYSDRFIVAATGVPEGEYNVSVGYDAAAFSDLPKSIVLPEGTLILPEDAVTIKTPSVVYKNEFTRPAVEVEYDPEKLEYQKIYCLPLTITESSAYAPKNDSTKSIFVKVEIKNSYEKAYASRMSVTTDTTNRTAAYAADKNPTSISDDVIDVQMVTNATIAGSTSATGTATTYNNTFMQVRVIPTDDKSHYDVEFIRVEVSESNKHKMSPETLEAEPDVDSYYDWYKEQYVLNYRFRQQVKKKVIDPDTGKSKTVTVEEGPWIHVSEILQAK